MVKNVDLLHKEASRTITLQRASLAVASGILLGISFPPLPFSLAVLVAFIALLFLFEHVTGTWRAVRYAYLSFLVFNVLTLYWVGGYLSKGDKFMMLGGLLLIVGHPFFFLIPVWLYLIVRKRLGLTCALIAFPFLWVGFEYVHSLGEIAFPWLTLGNTQALHPSRIQYAEWTGVYGVSFWIIVVNVLFFTLVRLFLTSKEQGRSFLSIAGLIVSISLLVAVPEWFGSARMERVKAPLTRQQVEKKALRVTLIQPNVDPWEKWENSPSSGFVQLNLLEQMTYRAAVRDTLQLVVWPETAIPYYILLPQYRWDFNILRAMVDSLDVGLLTGFPDAEFYPDSLHAPPGSKKLSIGGEWYQSFNGAMLLLPRSLWIQKYGKIILVPFAERPPYVDIFPFLSSLMWKMGLGGWNIGRDTTVFRFVPQGWAANDSVRFSTLICYESIYPGFVRNFVQKGAEFLVVITNDSWYGKTVGPYQHESFAAFRAIENRRWVARCANGGISCFIDPGGVIHSKSELYTQAIVKGFVEPVKVTTFYTKHGDLFSRIATGIGVVFVIVSFFKKKR